MHRSYYENQRQDVAIHLHKTENIKLGDVLEIGCASGKFRNKLSGARSYFGTDIEDKYFDFETKYEFESAFRKGDLVEVLNQLIDEGKKFHTIIANDVIEHISDHLLVLKLLNRILRSDGVLIGTVPNVRFYPVIWSLIFKGNWEYSEEGGVLDATHLRFFTVRSITQALKGSDYKIKKITPINGFSELTSIKRHIFYFCLFIFDLITFGKFADMKNLQILFIAEKWK